MKNVGFLLPLPDGDRFPRTGRTCKVRLIQKSPALAIPQTEPSAQLPPLVIELVNRGVTEATAVDLVKRHQAEAIEHQIDVFDWLMGKQDKRVAKSPAGYLVKSIDTGYKQPAGFVSRAEHQRRQEAKQARELQSAEDHRQEQEQKARDRATRQKVDAYLKQLDQAGRIAIEAEALAAASPADRESYESHVMARFRDTLMIGMIREYLAGKPELEQIAVEM